MNPTLYGVCFVVPLIILGLITVVGFGPGGIVYNSFAAKMMSVLGTSNFIVPTLQSIGAVGIFHPLLWIISAIPIGLCACVCFCL